MIFFAALKWWQLFVTNNVRFVPAASRLLFFIFWISTFMSRARERETCQWAEPPGMNDCQGGVPTKTRRFCRFHSSEDNLVWKKFNKHQNFPSIPSLKRENLCNSRLFAGDLLQNRDQRDLKHFHEKHGCVQTIWKMWADLHLTLLLPINRVIDYICPFFFASGRNCVTKKSG